MMLRMLLTAAALQLAVIPATLACEGQVGTEIFADDFADDSGGWDLAATQVKIASHEMTIAPDAASLGASSQNLTFSATDGDYCAEFVMPAQVGDDKLGFGIEFWATDYNNTMMFLVQSDQHAALYKRTAGNWNAIASALSVPSLKLGADASNTIRVQSVAGKLTLSLNGQTVKVIRAQMPLGDLRFGVFAQIDSAMTPAPAMSVKSFNVTTGH